MIRQSIFYVLAFVMLGVFQGGGTALAATQYATPTVINDTVTSAIAYTGSWQLYSARGVGDYADDVHATIYNNDYFVFTFTGTGVEYVTEKDSGLGDVDIYIDNVLQATVNCYNATRLSQQTVFSKTGLAPGTHTLKAVKKNGTYMIVDAMKFYPIGSVYVNNATSVAVGSYEIAYTGSWQHYKNRGVGDYDNDVHATIYNNDYFQFTFEGTGIDYISEKDAGLGTVDIYIDGVFQTTVNCYNGSLLAQQTVYSKVGLAPGTHTFKAVKTGGTYMMVDALKVYYDAQSLYDDYNKSIVYTSGAFSSSTALAGPLNGSMHWTTTANASAELSFYGNSIQYVGTKNTDHGFVDVYIDDVFAATVDTYGSSRQWQYVFFTKTWTTSGTHKIKIVCKNQKNAASSSIGFDLDVFKYTYDPEELAAKPLWQGTTMNNETLLLYSPDGSPASAPLLFAPTSIISVKSSRLDIEYLENVDWTYANGKLTRTANSRIPYVTYADMYPSTSSAYTQPRTGGGYIRYGGDTFWFDKQIVITYTHAANAWTGPTPTFAGSTLVNTMSKLNNHSNLKLVLYGDSISVGANTSAFMKVVPYMASWGKQVARSLEKVYGSNVSFVNPSVGGEQSLWGKNNAATYVASENPDLVIIAFGMNDGTAVSAVSPATFKSNIASIIDTVRATKPQAEFILVGTTLANSEAANFSSLQSQYITVLDQIAAEKTGVVTANMTGVHQTLLQTKPFRDMTGNNVNHPNDFLSRWYGQFITGLLVQ
ncbi:GDSL-type esterase/lipase family protein [Cohnella silvisoli]|uniref:GDSL-type esterase/lipase family protein n=1 Tax=Cohnella silvisoli TaxID=2873699 RepID=A0ABV1KME4_9BACL|nr:GDSL-type esterase/lipase family protein [Cohnella silvisoli]MCD9020436.1 hypothetical protein [Cohnella silvisoli]